MHCASEDINIFVLLSYLPSAMLISKFLKVCIQEKFFSNNIEVPLRIERSPIDLLKALSDTLQKDYTAPEYRFHDDPFFIPVNKNEKRSFALSKESGRMAARYFLDKYPNLFEDSKDFPKIEHFYSKNPQLLEVNKLEATDTKLRKLIELDANFDILFKNYKEIKDTGNSVNEETKLLLLQLFAFNNSSDPSIIDTEDETSGNDIKIQPGDDMYWYKNVTGLKPYRGRWKDMGYADQIWEDMETKDTLAYSIMIRGLAKYARAEKVKSLYEEMKANDIPLDCHIYNALLSVIQYQMDNADMQWIWVKTYMGEMAQNNIAPTLETFNEALKISCKNRNFKQASQLGLQILAEMRACHIEPSLGTFELILKGHYRDRRTHHTIIYDIVEYLKNKEYTIQHPNDVNFFTTAMNVCRNNMEDKALAHQLLEVYEYRNNRLLIGDHDNHHQFFSNYFRILNQYETVGGVIEAYNKYVPNEFCLDHGMAKDLLRFVLRALKEDTQDGASAKVKSLLEFVPRLWSDFKIFAIIITHSLNVSSKPRGDERSNNRGLDRDLDFFREFLKIMVSSIRVMQSPSLHGHDANLFGETKERFGAIAQEIVQRITQEPDLTTKTNRGNDFKDSSKINQDSGTSTTLSVEDYLAGMFNDVIQVLYHAQLFEDIWSLLRRFQQSDIITELSPSLLENIIKSSVTQNDIHNTMICFKIACHIAAPNVPQLYKLIKDACDHTNENTNLLMLNEKDKAIIDAYLDDYEVKKKSLIAKDSNEEIN